MGRGAQTSTMQQTPRFSRGRRRMVFITIYHAIADSAHVLGEHRWGAAFGRPPGRASPSPGRPVSPLRARITPGPAYVARGDAMGAARVCAGCVPGACRVYAGCTPGVRRVYAGCMPGVCRVYTGCTPPGESRRARSPGPAQRPGSTFQLPWCSPCGPSGQVGALEGRKGVYKRPPSHILDGP